MSLRDGLDDATRSRLSVLVRKLGGGRLNLYAITERAPQMLIMVVSTCSEEALRLIRDELGLDWCLCNTICRSLQRNVDAEPAIITAFRLNHG